MRYAALEKLKTEAELKKRWERRDRARRNLGDVTFRIGVIAATMNAVGKYAAEVSYAIGGVVLLCSASVWL